jgi:hypothetical protein
MSVKLYEENYICNGADSMQTLCKVFMHHFHNKAGTGRVTDIMYI